jgi:hypothetical protein
MTLEDMMLECIPNTGVHPKYWSASQILECTPRVLHAKSDTDRTGRSVDCAAGRERCKVGEAGARFHPWRTKAVRPRRRWKT